MYDSKCYDLACDFLDDHIASAGPVSRERERWLRGLLAQAIQTTIEETLEGFTFDARDTYTEGKET